MRIKRIWTRICLLAIMMAASSIISTQTVFADGWSGENTSGGSHTDSGNCSKNGDWDSCGAGFIRMDVNDPNPTRLISNWTGSGYEGTKTYINNTVVPACKKVGASEFYLLVLHVFQGGKPTGTFGLTRKVGDIIAGGGYKGAQGWMGTRYRSGSNALAFSDVLGIYEYARFTYAPAHPEQEWGDFLTKPWSNVTAFCWNPKWKTEEAETSFGAFSIVVSDEINKGKRNSTYPTQDDKKTWEITSNEDKVRVTFAHKFFYYGGNKLSSNTTEKASTDWQVTVTRDGKGYYEPDHVGAIDGINFQGTYSVPGYNKSSSFSGSNGSGCPGNICNEDVGVNTYDIDISNLGLGESTVVCSKIDYDPKTLKWRSENGKPFTIINRNNAKKSSTGCVKIIRGASENIEFWSNSSVQDVSGNGGKVTSPNDGEANLTINLNEGDEGPIKLDFWHNLHYTGKIPENLNQDICTTYTISGDGNPAATLDDNPLENGTQYCANKHSAANKGDDLGALGNKGESVGGSTVEVNAPSAGNKVTVCQQTNYHPKTVLVLQNEQTGEVVLETNGSGSSKACVTITRTKAPESEQKSDLFYTGEESPEISWSLTASTNAFHRLLGGKMFYYQVPVQVGGGAAQENSHYEGGAPRDWFSSKSEGFRDGHYLDIQMDEDFVDHTGYVMDPITGEVTPDPIKPTFSESQVKKIVTPDNVGDKICNSSAVQYQDYEKETYYVRVCGWHSCWNEPRYRFKTKGEPYWVIQGATCNPIVKKPSMNVWNGSLFTNGNANIATTVSNRFDPANFGVEVTPSLLNQRKKFGSWSEYLAVVGGAVKDKPFGFGSGTSLSFQGAGANSELLANSPLTIANNNGGSNIGKASISPSSTYLSRLKTYIYDNDSLKSDPNVKIVECGSECNITSNVIVNQGANSVHDIKQQYIYHATGDINISSEVTQIDAWLISENGVVNTCKDYRDVRTEAKVQGYARTSNAECSKQLTINGPVIARGVVLNRTAGSDPLTYTDTSLLGGGTNSRSIPGEVFNLSASAYLWAYAQASRSSSSYTESYSRELPPRY